MQTATRTQRADVDEAFIRRGVALADLDAVRVALYQLTGDPSLVDHPKAADLNDAQREALIDKAVAWLVDNAGPAKPPEPEEPVLRHLMEMAGDGPMDDIDFEARRELPGFREFPNMVDWSGAKPEMPDGFLVTIVGSGFSGITMAVQLEQLEIPYQILERREESGGTWSIHRYPDIRVDTISATYEFPFEKDHRWSEYFARGPEVRDYIDSVARRRGIHEKIRFGHDLEEARFDEAANVWTMKVRTSEGVRTLTTNAIVGAHGTFANPRRPDIAGIDEYTGTLVHPSLWPTDLDLTGKRVAIIGNGSTGVQMLAPIAEAAEHVHVFQRTPQWIAPRAKYGDPVEPETNWLFDNFPGYWNWFRYRSIAPLFQTHGFLRVDEDWVAEGGQVNAMSDALRADLTAYIRQQVEGDEDLIEKLVPDYAPFCRRPVVDNNWYRSLIRSNVDLVTEPIETFTTDGIRTDDGKIREFDVVVTATGFEVSRYLWPTAYHGPDGVDIHDRWEHDGPRAYLGMMMAGYPNLFMIYGPNSQPLSGGTGLPIWFAVWSAYIARCLMRMLETGGSRIEVTQEAFEQYNRELDLEAAGLVLMQEEGMPERNYYVNEFGRLQVNAPWYGPLFHEMCTVVEWDHLEMA